MAEFVASIAGLATTAEVVCTRIYKYIKQVKDATREIRELSAEVNGLYGTLKSLSLVVDNIEGACSTAIVEHTQITAYAAALDRLRDRLTPFDNGSSGKIDVARKKWKWPFSRSETLEFKQQIESHKASLSLALSADTVSATLEALTATKSIAHEVEKVHVLLQAQARIQLDEKKERILNTIGPRNPLRHHETNVELRQSGTGTIWVHGIPEAGKSVLVALAITRILESSDEDNAVAYFYCDYKDAETQDPTQVLGSLAEQVARQSERSLQKLEDFVIDHCQGGRLKTFKCSCEKLCELLVDMSSDFRNLSVAIDGLDECGDNMRAVISYVTDLSHKSTRIRTFISSRDLIDIRDFTEDFETVSIAAKSIDLRLYVAAEIEKRMQKSSHKRLYLSDPSLKGEIMDRLIDGAEGMFRWVAVHLDYICEQCSDADIRTALHSLPPDMFSSYERLLRDINKKSATTQKLVQQALKWIMWEGPINAKALGEALAVRLGVYHLDVDAIVSQERILQLCGSLIRRSVDGSCLESAHFTVMEFLLSLGRDLQSNLNSYGLVEIADQEHFAIVALNYLCLNEFDGSRSVQSQVYNNSWDGFNALISRAESIDSFLFIALEALIYARDSHEPPEVLNLLKRLFSHAHHNARRMLLYLNLEDPRASHNFFEQADYITPLHHAAMMRLPRLCESLLMDQNDSNARSPLGTPLQCAVFGLYNIDFNNRLYDDRPNDLFFWGCQSISLDENAIMTIQVLIDRGADASVTFRGFSDTSASYSILYPLLFSHEPYPDKILQSLLDAGALYCEKCLDIMECWTTGSVTCSEATKEALDSPKLSKDLEFLRSLKPQHVNLGLESRLSSVSLALSHRHRKEGNGNLGKILEFCTSVEAVESLLSNSIKYDNLETVKIMLDHNIVGAGWRAKDNRNAMHIAIEDENMEAAELFVNHGIAPDQQSQDGSTPLHLAVAMSLPHLVRFLLLHCDDASVVDNQGHTIFHVAAKLKESQILNLLIRTFDSCKALINERDYEGKTPLILACTATTSFSALENVKQLARLNVDRSIKDKKGWAAVHYAVSHDNLDILQILSEDCICWLDKCTVRIQGLVLLRYGHEIDVMDFNGNTPMTIARRGRSDGIVSLLRKGRDPQDHATIPQRIDELSSEKAALRLSKARQRYLSLAIQDGDIEDVQNLMREDASLLSSSLHDCSEFLREILDRSPGLLFVSSEVHPIHIAIANGSNDCLQMMLERSEEAWHQSITKTTGTPTTTSTSYHDTCVDFDRRTWPTIKRKLPILATHDLSQVCMRLPLSSVWSFSTKLNSSTWNLEWSSPIHFAILIANFDAVRILLDAGASASDMPEGCRYSPLHLALLGRKWNIANLLLEQGAPLQSRDSWGITCADMIFWCYAEGFSSNVVTQALRFVSPNLSEALVPPSFTVRNDLQWEILHTWSSNDLTRFDQNGETLIHRGWNSGNLPLIAWVLNHNVDWNCLDKAFGSSIHCCWLNSARSLLRRLLKRVGSIKGAYLLNFKPERRNTPLYNAAAMDQRKIIDLMLKQGAQIDLIGGLEGSPLMVAAAYGRLETVEMLIHAGASTSYLDPKEDIMTSVFEKAKDFPEVQRWLLVDRWRGRRFIEWKGTTVGFEGIGKRAEESL
ncbi:MAG: hypothetical protein Q9160_003720 [Pyrenula sp. 1 TL-2023]